MNSVRSSAPAARTGAGGANDWTLDATSSACGPEEIEQVPAGTEFRVALRRVTRVRTEEWIPLEDLVEAHTVHRLTQRHHRRQLRSDFGRDPRPRVGTVPVTKPRYVVWVVR
jgi:hypothetical protein